MKNLEKVEKIMNIRDYSKKFEHFLVPLNVFYHIHKSEKLYLNTEKTSKILGIQPINAKFWSFRFSLYISCSLHQKRISM